MMLFDVVDVVWCFMCYVKDDQNGKRLKLKTTKMEDDQNGRLPKWKMTEIWCRVQRRPSNCHRARIHSWPFCDCLCF